MLGATALAQGDEPAAERGVRRRGLEEGLAQRAQVEAGAADEERRAAARLYLIHLHERVARPVGGGVISFGRDEVDEVVRDAASLGFPVWAPAPDRPEGELVPATRYAIGDSLFGMEAYPGREGQLDLVLWSERIRAVIAGDTLIDLGTGSRSRRAGYRKA